MRRILQIILTITFGIGSCFVGLPTQVAVASGCDDVQFIFARGSGESLNDSSYQSWRSTIEEQLVSSTLKYNFYELGSQPQGGAQYPAVAVAGSLSGFGNLLGAFISAGHSFEFGKSVLVGRNELKAYLHKTTTACPSTKFVLGGYSQGAMVISGVLDEIDASKIIYIATFGDPKIYLPEGAGNRPDACRGKNLSNYRAYVPDCHTYEGVLGSYQPYQPAEYIDKLGTWCNGQDIMCSSGMSIGDHTAYSSSGLYRSAASVIAYKLRQIFVIKFPNQSITDISPALVPHDMVIMLHGGGGMEGLTLAKYKAAAQRLANQTYSLGGRVALYVYGDNSKWASRQLCDFSCTAEEFNQQLARITHQLSAVDYYNSALSSLYRSMSELDWQIGATKSAVLLTDQPYSQVDYDGRTVAEVAALSLSIDPVNIYALTNQHNLEAIRPLAQATNGKAYDIEDVTIAITEITGRPVASLSLESYEGTIGEEIVFDASNDLSQEIVRYDWDLDADGVFEIQDGNSQVRKIYSSPISGYIQVRVTDRQGYSSTMSASLKITTTAPILPEISNVRVTQETATSYRIDFTTNAEKILVALNDAPAGQIRTATQKHLIIEDVTSQIAVRLIPYSSRTGRGAAATVKLGQAPEVPIDPELPDEADPTPGNQDGDNVVSNSRPTPGVIKRPAQTSSSAIFIPKAPNTGVKPN